MSDERSHEFTHGQYGWITHTDLSSTDAAATRDGVPKCSAGPSNRPSRLRAVTTTCSHTRTRAGAASVRRRQTKRRGQPRPCTSRTPERRTTKRWSLEPNRLARRPSSWTECAPQWSVHQVAC